MLLRGNKTVKTFSLYCIQLTDSTSAFVTSTMKLINNACLLLLSVLRVKITKL